MSENKNKVPTRVMVEPEIWKQFKTLATMQGIPIHEMLDDAITKYVEYTKQEMNVKF